MSALDSTPQSHDTPESPTPVRLILDSAASGAWNMSVDQAILESVEQTLCPTLRIYRWEPATLSLGYFQLPSSRTQHKESLACPMVRRASGGGAIVHDYEITYSLCVPADNRWAQQNNALYGSLHDSVVETFQDWGVELQTYRSDQDPPAANPNDFLCFLRRSNGDLVWQGHKVVGSAQRRNKNAILQHGSILLERSTFAPQLPGILDLASGPINQEQWLQSLIEKVCLRLGFQTQTGQLSAAEHELAERISAVRFDNDDWNLHRKKHPL